MKKKRKTEEWLRFSHGLSLCLLFSIFTFTTDRFFFQQYKIHVRYNRKPVQLSCFRSSRASYSTLVFEQGFWVSSKFRSIKAESCFCGRGDERLFQNYPRTYILSHCDVTTKLTLTISNVINLEQVLKAVLYGDSLLFGEHPELMDAFVQVYFHSSSKIYNRMEYWGTLKDAAEGRAEIGIQGQVTANKEGSHSPKNLARPKRKSTFQALFAFLL